jgi:hypothetical protein
VLVAALCVGGALRCWRFGSLPLGLNPDEASMAYDAWSLFHYGIDRNGFHLPVMTVSWGSGMYALASYLVAPFVGLFGLSVTAARLPFLFVGLATLPLFYRLLDDVFDRRCARIGCVLLALCPWHIMISRWALDCNLLPPVFLAATALLVRSPERPGLLVPAGIGYALALYAYGTAYLVVPAFLLLAVAYGLIHRCWPRRALLVAGAVSAVLAAPIVLYVAINNLGWESIRTPLFSIPRLSGVPRYSTVGNVHLLSSQFWSTAARNLGVAARLLREQDDRLIANVLPEFGFLYWFTPCLALLGLGLLLGRSSGRAFQRSFFVLAWCAAGAVLTLFVSSNINRLNVGLLPLLACAALAVSVLWQYRALALLLSLALTTSAVGFVSEYFGNYGWRAAPAFLPSLVEGIRYVAARTEGEVCVIGPINMPYIFVLFATTPDPRDFLQTVVYENPGAEFQRVASFGRYRFGAAHCPPSARGVIALGGNTGGFPVMGFSARAFGSVTAFTR